MGPDLLRRHSHLAHRSGAYFWRGAGPFARPRHHYPAGRDGRHDGDGGELRTHGHRYLSAGSVYTYVSRGFNSQIGFVVGWAMFLEYLIQPLQNSLYTALTLQRLVPALPFPVLSAIAVGFMHAALLVRHSHRRAHQSSHAGVHRFYSWQHSLARRSCNLCASALAGTDFHSAFVRSKNFQRAGDCLGTVPPTNSTKPVPIRLRTPSTSLMIRETNTPVLLAS